MFLSIAIPFIQDISYDIMMDTFSVRSQRKIQTRYVFDLDEDGTIYVFVSKI